MENIETMENIEKLLFLHIRQYQFSANEESEILATYRKMTDVEKNTYHKLQHELHKIYSYINSAPKLNVRPNDGVQTVEAYNEKIHPVSDIILKVVFDFNFTLKKTMTKKVKASIITLLGEDYFNKKFSGIEIIDDIE
jgi:hypothetical protein